MKKLLIPLSALCAFSLAALPVIVLPRDANIQEKKAADELALNLKAAAGKAAKIVSEEAAPAQGKRIYVGRTAFAKKNGADFSALGEEEHFVKAVSSDELIIGGGFPRGTLYGVYEFLENTLNAMWLDEENIFIEKVDDVTWKKDLLLRGRPALPYRSIYSHFGKGSELYKIRNRQNWFHTDLPGEFDGFGIPTLFGRPRFNHSFYDYTKDVPDGDTDILSLTAGKRVRSTSSLGPGQICYSNPKTVEWFWKKFESYVAADRKGRRKWQYPRIYTLATNDNRNECQCPGCQALVKKYGWSGAKLHFVNQIAERAAKKYPDVVFKTDSYGLHGFLPKNGLKPAKNVWIGISYGSTVPGRERDYFRPYSDPVNKLTRDLHRQWHEVATLTVGDYWIDYNRPQYPSAIVRTIAENLKFYKSLGVKSVKPECQGAHVTSFWRMRTYIGYRFMADPGRDIDAEIERFCRAYYGKAAPQMLALHRLLEEGMAKLPKCVDSYPIGARVDLDEEFFKKAEALINEGDRLTKDDPLRNDRVTDEWAAIAWAKIDKFKVSDRAYIENFRKVAMRRMKLQNAYHVKRLVPRINMLCDAALAKLPPIKGFENAAVISEYGWPQLSSQRYNKIIDDPDAAGGKAAIPSHPYMTKEKMTRSGIDMGISDTAARKRLISLAGIPAEAVPRDGKYHWYYLGRCRLSGNPLVFMHRSWTLQLYVNDAIRPPDLYDNDVGVYVSLKVTDSVYAVDRVVVVRGDVSRGCPGTPPLPPEIKKERVIADLAGTSLHGKKVFDPTAAAGCAVSAGVPRNGKVRVLFIDRTGKEKTVSKLIAPEKDKYRPFSIRSGMLTGNCQLKVGGYRIELGNYFELAKPDRKFEILISCRLADDGKVLVDRCLLLEAK
ncbi:MAG: DUF4838 domain-containing protein [Lentisphaeria bacterium]|nr:DUF4838 domain-containing protein [Lentisphaeria bacterium]